MAPVSDVCKDLESIFIPNCIFGTNFAMLRAWFYKWYHTRSTLKSTKISPRRWFRNLVSRSPFNLNHNYLYQQTLMNQKRRFRNKIKKNTFRTKIYHTLATKSKFPFNTTLYQLKCVSLIQSTKYNCLCIVRTIKEQTGQRQLSLL